MVDDKFRVDNMFYQMCVNPLGVFSHDGMDSRDNFDASTAFFTEFRPDGTMNRYNIESFGDDKKIVGSDLTMETELTFLDKWSALSKIYDYTQSNDVYQSTMLAYDTFATREVNGETYVYGWYNRSK
jgi:hypothetical protein